MFDFITFRFIFTVSLITLRVLIFRKSYIFTDKNNKKFFSLLMVFVLRIILLIISPNNLRILLGWDGLGVSSYLLVIYYNSNKSNTSGMITLLINRIGDALILRALAIQLKYLSWATRDIVLTPQTKILITVFTLGLITKSAQIPFSSWLPAAIAAPTPVSSLVHSSTLVTAGIYLIIRMTSIYKKTNLSMVLLILGTLTTLIASLLALKENDIKKIVALSTLRQLGFIVSMLGLNCWFLAFRHLMNHAFFKALLFISTGNIIHSSNDSQDLKITSNKRLAMFNSLMIVFITSLSIIGLTFLSAFYAKEIIIENIFINKSSVYIIFFLVITIFLTPTYTIRRLRIFYFLIIKSHLKNYCENKDPIIKTRIFLLLIPTFLSGFYINKVYYFKEAASTTTQTYLILAFLMTATSARILYFLNQLKSLTLFIKKTFHTSMWGLTQMFYLRIPILTNNTPIKLIQVEKTLLTFAFNILFYQNSTNRQIRKIYLNFTLITIITTILFFMRHYLNNILKQTLSLGKD